MTPLGVVIGNLGNQCFSLLSTVTIANGLPVARASEK